MLINRERVQIDIRDRRKLDVVELVTFTIQSIKLWKRNAESPHGVKHAEALYSQRTTIVDEWC